MRKAVIDIGSNSLLLTVAEVQDQQIKQILFESSVVTGLGVGVKNSGLIKDSGFTETLAALKDAFQKANSLNSESILAAGTMALRIAKNAPDFQSHAERQGTPITIITGEQEAQLGLEAVCQDPEFNTKNRITIIDPGGHSTELVTADITSDGPKVCFRKSFPVGALGILETHMPNESPDFRQRLATVAAIDQIIGMEYLPHKCGTVVTLGATGTNLVTIREKMVTWDAEAVHGQTLDFEEIGRAVGWLCDKTNAERAQIPGLEPKRESTIHIGVLILERFMQATHALECKVSTRGWRHALIVKD